jgi:hypothetical protein
VGAGGDGDVSHAHSPATGAASSSRRSSTGSVSRALRAWEASRLIHHPAIMPGSPSNALAHASASVAASAAVMREMAPEPVRTRVHGGGFGAAPGRPP